MQPGEAGPATAGAFLDLGGLGDLVDFQGGREPLPGSGFLLALGGGQGAGGNGPGLRVQVWGQDGVQTFQGAPSDTTGYNGELRSGYLQSGYGMLLAGGRLLTWVGSMTHSPLGPHFTFEAEIGIRSEPAPGNGKDG